MVDTKSRSVLRIYKEEHKRPTHRAIVEFLAVNFHEEITPIVCKIHERLTADVIYDLLQKYPDSILSRKKKDLLIEFLKSKVQIIFDSWRGVL